MNKYITCIGLAVFLLLGDVQSQTVHSSIISTNSSISFTAIETWASGWVPPTSWKQVYADPVIQSEMYADIKTKFVWPQTVRLNVWVQNPLKGAGLFPAPAGEIDYALCLSGPVWYGANFSTEVRLIDVASATGASVGDVGDNDIVRFRLRLDRPFKFSTGIHTLTPALIYYRVEPMTYRVKTEGNVLSPQLNYDWRPDPRFRLTLGSGFMHDDGEKGGIPANIVSYWISTGVKLRSKSPECWLNTCYQRYDTLNRPANRPVRNFDLVNVSLSVKF